MNAQQQLDLTASTSTSSTVSSTPAEWFLPRRYWRERALAVEHTLKRRELTIAALEQTVEQHRIALTNTIRHLTDAQNEARDYKRQLSK